LLLLPVVVLSLHISRKCRVSASPPRKEDGSLAVSVSGNISRAASKADLLFTADGDETNGDGPSRGASKADLLQTASREETDNTTDTYPSQQGSFFLVHGGHHPSVLNPSKLDIIATQKNASTQAIGANQDGVYDFGLGYQRSNTSTEPLLGSGTAGPQQKQFSSSLKEKVSHTALNSTGAVATDGGGAVGSNSSRKAIGSKPSGLFFDLATMNLSDPLAILFKEGESRSTGAGAGAGTGTGTGSKPPNNVSAPASSQRVINVIQVGTKPAANISTPDTSPKLGTVVDAGAKLSTNISAPATTSKLDNVVDTGTKPPTNVSVPATSAPKVPVNIGTGADLFDYSFYDPFEVKIVGGDLVSKEKSIAKYPYYTNWFEANCGGSLIHDDSKFSMVSTLFSGMM
jgi:hypothetical protein